MCPRVKHLQVSSAIYRMDTQPYWLYYQVVTYDGDTPRELRTSKFMLLIAYHRLVWLLSCSEVRETASVILTNFVLAIWIFFSPSLLTFFTLGHYPCFYPSFWRGLARVTEIIFFLIYLVNNGYFLQFSKENEGAFQTVSCNIVLSLWHQILAVDELHYYTGLLGR